MHTVVSAWFGVSTLWFAPLAWRLAKAVLPGGAGMGGPGTIRLWLGFVCVLAASCALEASLVPATGNALGHALITGANHAPGAVSRAGTPLAALVVLLASLPWFLGFRWQAALRAADRAFGLGLGSSFAAAGSARQAKSARPQAAARDDDVRTRPAGVNGMRVTTVNTMVPKSGGRYTRPTVWRPPVVSRGGLSGKTGGVAPDAGAMPPAARPQSEPPRPAAASQIGLGARTARPVPPPARRPREASTASAPSRGRATSLGQIASPAAVRSPTPRPQEITPPLPVAATPASPLTAQTGPAAVPPSVQETLRAIEANAAQWTALAGIGLARRAAASEQQVCAAENAEEDRRDEAPAAQASPSSIASQSDGARAPTSTELTLPPATTEQAAPTASTSSPLAFAAVASIGPAAADRAPAYIAPAAADAWPADASPPDASPADASPADASPADASPPDASPADTSRPDASPANTPADPSLRPAILGHAATEFAFHAPAAASVELPSLDLLERPSHDAEPIPAELLAQTGQLIEQRLQEFKVPVTVVGASAGPVITRFEVEPALGVRGSQIVGLMKDLSRGLGLTSIRVVETIPGKTCMGLELPNAKRQMIRLSEILAADAYRHSASKLTIAMGKDITGHPIVTDLAKAPHMLVAGTTGSGKSVAINAMILSLLFKATPEDVRLIMIDPKMLELSVYEGIPHLLAPVVTDMKLAANALNWCVGEMEKRYRLMSAVGVRNLAGFNQKVRDAEAAEKKLTNPFSLTPEAPEPLSRLPLIVVVIDELADLMMVAGKKIEELIARLAQKARAAGIHLILATQRPSVDVITGLIKANIPTRVAFQVSSKIDSRTILDQMGAESLLGQGDMLFLPPGTGYPQRVHGAFVADEEVHRIVEHLKQFGEPQYEEGILETPAAEGTAQDLFGEAPDAEADPLYDEAVAFVVRTRRASISAVQRQLRIGYNRAARLVEQMEAAGLVSSMSVNGSREVLAPPAPEQ